MLASGGVEAGVSDSEAFDWLVGNDVRLHDFRDISERDMAIPYCLGIDDHGGPVLALIEASGLVGTYGCLNAGERQLTLQFEMQVCGSGRIAGAAGMVGSALIAADENMFREFGHGKLQDYT
jgi:hypothetical protein